MLLIGLASFVVGALLATLMPLVQFALGLVIVAFAAVTFSVLGLGRMADAIALGLTAFGCAQVGYVAGLGAWAVVRHKRSQRLDRGDVGGSAVPPLHEPL